MAEAVAPAGGILSFREVLRESGAWIRRNWVRTLIFSVASFLVGWVWNTYIMAKGLEGSVPEPGSTTVATAEGKSWNGVYWLLVATIGFGMVTYARERGISGFFADLAQLPKTISASLRRNPRGAWAMLLWGMALTLTISTILSKAIAGVLAFGLLLAAASPLATILNNVVIRIWVGVFSSAAPKARDELPGMANPFMLMTGEAVGMLIAYFSDETAMKIGLAVLCAVGGYFVVAGTGNRPAPSAAGVVLFAVAAVVVWKVLRAAPALADDGGWLECVTDDGTPCSERGWRGILDWYRSDGADKVIAQGRVGGFFSAVGAAIGCGVGGAMGALTSAMRGAGPPFGSVAGTPAGTPPVGSADVGLAQDTVGSSSSAVVAEPASAGAPSAPSAPSAPAAPPPPPEAAAPAAPSAPAAPEPAAASTAAAADTGLPSKGDVAASADSGLPSKGEGVGTGAKDVGDRPQVDLKMGVERTDAGAAASGGPSGAGRGAADLPTKARSLDDLPSKGDALGEVGKEVGDRPGADERMGVRGRGADAGDLPTKSRSAADLPSKGDVPAADATKDVADRPEVDLKMGVREGHGPGRGADDLPTSKRSGEDLLRERTGEGGPLEDVLPDEDKFRERRGRRRRGKGPGSGDAGGDDRVV